MSVQSPPSPPATRKDKAIGWVKRHPVWTGVIVFVAAAMLLSPFTSSSKDTAGATAKSAATPVDVPVEQMKEPGKAQKPPAATPTPSPAPTPAPPSNRQLADEAASKVKGARVTSYGSQLVVTFPIHDNLSDGLRRAGIASDTFDLMKAMKDKGVNFKTLVIHGTFDMVDKYGKELPDDQVYTAVFTHAVVNRITYENIETTELDALREFTTSGYIVLHPAFGYDQS